MKLVTWNAQWCKGIDGLVSPERIVAGARALADFDVLCLQEISQNYPKLTGHTPRDQPAEIARLLPGFEVVFGAAINEQPAASAPAQRFGNLIASRLPILQIQHFRLPSPVGSIDSIAPHSWMPRVCTVCTVQARWGPVRVMTTHLEYHSHTQRLAQAQALRQIHQELCDVSQYPPIVLPDETGTPYQAKPHTGDAVLCGDFNFEPHSEPYRALATAATEPTPTGASHALLDAWLLAHPDKSHPPTFRLYDDRYGPNAVSCDFCFLSESVAPRLKNITVDTSTQVSDHQPLMIELM